jgi:hypothetical protein
MTMWMSMTLWCNKLLLFYVIIRALCDDVHLCNRCVREFWSWHVHGSHSVCLPKPGVTPSAVARYWENRKTVRRPWIGESTVVIGHTHRLHKVRSVPYILDLSVPIAHGFIKSRPSISRSTTLVVYRLDTNVRSDLGRPERIQRLSRDDTPSQCGFCKRTLTVLEIRTRRQTLGFLSLCKNYGLAPGLSSNDAPSPGN